ncbi:MAG: hypothetical protein K8S62_10240 [Candidatus Sabulitectum sp.]|nr:hypothetical protein [Candidatus Sabulitectum sp.]
MSKDVIQSRAGFCVLLLCSGAFYLSDGAFLDNEWMEMNPPSGPSARWSLGLEFDSANGVCILFGGQDGSQEFDDTWLYDYAANTWTEVNPTISAPSRFGHNMAYNSADSVIVLFGGVSCYDSKSACGDTWIYSVADSQWTEMTPAISPPARAYCGLVYDSVHNAVILFGGYNYVIGQYYNDTWVYDLGSNTWTNMNPSTKPCLRNCHGMAFDSANGVVVMHGGWLYPNMLGDTWTYDAGTNTWTDMSPANSPPSNYQHDIAFDSASNTTVLFGGFNRNTMTYYEDTWVYDYSANSWTDAEPVTHPTGRGKFKLAYDSLDQRFILFGGYAPASGETWAYEPAYVAVESYETEMLPESNGFHLSCQNPAITGFALLRYHAPIETALVLRMYDSAGRLERTFVNGIEAYGAHELFIDTGELASGMHLVTLQFEDGSGHQGMISEKIVVIGR